MYVLDVIPLAAGAPEGTLSYRSKTDSPPGTIVDITLRGKSIRGIVTASTPVREAKGVLKTASFMLKAGAPSRAGLLPSELFSAAVAIATYHAAPLGPTLAALLGTNLSDGNLPEKLAPGEGYAYKPLEASYRERLTIYRNIIERSLQEKKLTVLIAPTTIEVARFEREFTDLSPIVLSGAQNKKVREATLASAYTASGLVIATPAYAIAPFTHVATYIIERISAHAYVLPKRPYLDMRVAVRSIAEARNVHFITGDYPLPLEWREKGGEATAAHVTPLVNDAVELLDAKLERAEGEAFRAVPAPIIRHIRTALQKNGRAAVLAVRKGYSPAVVCRDCGSAVRDEAGRTLSFATTRGDRVFRSADGSIRKAAATVCDVCGSWNLLPLGIGIERVAEEIGAAFPTARLVQIDTDAVRTPAQAKKTLAASQEPSTIIIGTEFMLPFLDPLQPLTYAAIASADTLLAAPFWRARERLVHLGLTLRERAEKVTIATRRIDDLAFSAIASPSSTEFFGEEAEQRAAFSYPPYGHLVMVHAEVPASRKEAQAAAITRAFGNHPYTRLPDRVHGTKAHLAIVAKYPEHMWPNQHAAAMLSALPPWAKVTVDGESLW